jgi:multidrug efflux system outer membrane protein
VSAQLDDLFSSSTRSWSYAGQLAGPLFNGGRVVALNSEAKALREESLVEYEQAIQNAFREVEDALIDSRKTGERADSLRRELEAAREYSRLAQESYTNGYSTYFQVLDAERQLFSAELAFTQAEGDRYAASILLYKVLGGGWIEAASAAP